VTKDDKRDPQPFCAIQILPTNPCLHVVECAN
jgi:hypothetical protein